MTYTTITRRICRASLLTWMTLVATVVSANEDIPYLRCFEIASQQHQIPLPLLLGVARVESNFDPDARSHANAHGIMQVQWPGTAKHLGVRRVSELYNPCVNIDVGAGYLRELMQRFDQDRTLALAAYNYGPTRLNSRADIPRTVNGYVDSVIAAAEQVSNSSTQSTPVLLKGGADIEVLGFTSRVRADRYIRTIRKLVPAAQLRVEHRQDRQYYVMLDPAPLSPLDLKRLAQLLPENQS